MALPSRLNPLPDFKKFIIPLLIITTAITGGWFLQHLNKSQQAPLIWDGRNNSPCPLRNGLCTAVTPYGPMTLHITPETIPLMQALQISLYSPDTPTRHALVRINGLNMNMAELAFSLSPGKNNNLIGQGILPICQQQRMQWQALVRITIPEGDILLPFSFETHNQTLQTPAL